MSLNKIKTCMDRVEYLLDNYAHLRDDDNKLVANYWFNEVGETKDFLKNYAAGKITQADSITRARRKLQELHPHLRGEKYNERHKEEKKVRKSIVNI